MARSASVDKVTRILAMVPWVLQHPEQATVSGVCTRFGINESTLLDDLNMLIMCGIPPFGPGDLIEAGVEGDMVVIRMADFLARPLRLTRLEAVTLLASGRALAAVMPVDEAPALHSALDKVQAAIAPAEAQIAAALADRVAIEFDAVPPQTLTALRDAITDHRTLRIEYYSLGRDEISERDIDPLVVLSGQPSYLIAHDHSRNAQVTFRIDRIHSIAQTGTAFTRPEGFDAAQQSAAYQPSAGDRTVVLDLAPAARWVVEQTPHVRAVRGDDGWTRMTLKASATAWLEHLLLMLGADARVVEPGDLAQAVKARAREALALYEQPQA